MQSVLLDASLLCSHFALLYITTFSTADMYSRSTIHQLLLSLHVGGTSLGRKVAEQCLLFISGSVLPSTARSELRLHHIPYCLVGRPRARLAAKQAVRLSECFSALKSPDDYCWTQIANLVHVPLTDVFVTVSSYWITAPQAVCSASVSAAGPVESHITA